MKEFIGKTKMKQWFVKQIKPFIKQHEFSIRPRSGVPTIFLERDNIDYFIYIMVAWDDHLSFSAASISHNKVEELLYQITKLEVYNKNSDTLRVCFDKEKTAVIYKQEDVIEFSEIFKKNFLEYFLPAFEKYSDPKNVLELWDSLDDEGKLKHFFDPYKNCKILILSKMCNDPKFPQRCVDEYNFYKKHYESGLLSAKVLMDDCEKVIKYLEENEI